MIALLVAESVCDDAAHCAGLLTFNATLLAQIGIFLVTAAILWFLLWKPVVGVITRREEAIAVGARASGEADDALAASAREVADLLVKAREEARTTTADAGRDASARAAAKRVEARDEARRLVEVAQADIAAEQVSALVGLRAQTEALIGAAAERLLGADVDIARYRGVIGEVLES